MQNNLRRLKILSGLKNANQVSGLTLFKVCFLFFRKPEAICNAAVFCAAEHATGHKKTPALFAKLGYQHPRGVGGGYIVRGHIRLWKNSDLIVASALAGHSQCVYPAHPDVPGAAAADFHARPVHARHQRPVALLCRRFDGTGIFRWTASGSAFLGAIIISIVSVALNILTGTGGSRITIPVIVPAAKSDDDGPVIDV